MKLLVLDAAQAELEEARDYYLQHGTPRIAAAFVDAYEHGLRRLIDHPQIGKVVAGRHRQLTLRNFPYSIIYRQTVECIVIDAVAHQRRSPGYWQERR